MSSLIESRQRHKLRSYRIMGLREDHWRIGTDLGAAEARKAITAYGAAFTWKTAHEWLNQAVGSGLQEQGISLDFSTYERGCRIMFMLKIRHALFDDIELGGLKHGLTRSACQLPGRFW